MDKVIVVGGGAAGMMAAIQAARCGARVVLIEKNEKLGKKLFITGKGRCNLTNACDLPDLFTSIVSNPKFLYSAIYSFSNDNVIDFFEELGVKTKVERGNRVFPVSDKSSDVIRALEKECRRLGIEILLHTAVKEILVEESTKAVTGVRLANQTKIKSSKVILATGGVSYPRTGSDISGMRLAKAHNIVTLRPGLIGMVTKENTKRLQGLSCHICKMTITTEKSGGKKLFEESGEILFTHFGVSGPIILTASSLVGDCIQKYGSLSLHVDFKPWLTEEELDRDLLECFQQRQNADIKKVLGALLPDRLVVSVLEQCGISLTQKANSISRDMRKDICKKIKDLVFTITRLHNMEEAIITRGGIDVKEINPSTMESRVTKGLFLAGEMIDVDALTGGYNLQIAWSTGYLAGVSAAENEFAHK